MDNYNLEVIDTLKGTRKLITGAKVVFTILALVVIAELIYTIKVFVSPVVVPPLPQVRTSAGSNIARISLSADKLSYKMDELINIQVIVNTGIRRIIGTDLIVRFDPQILEVNKDGLTKGRIFDEYPQIIADNDKGLISISGVSSLGNSFKGSGQFATLNFKAKASGKTMLAVDFKKNSTALSNLVELSSSKNILDTVDDLDLQVQ